MVINYKLLDDNGYLVNRCNRCGKKLDNEPPCWEGESPICLLCFKVLATKMQRRSSNKRAIEYQSVKAHRLDYYNKAVNDLFDHNGNPIQVKVRWQKLKEVSK